MRAVFTTFFVAVSVTFVIATPLTRQKRFAVGSFAGAGYPFTGAYAGSGFNPFFPFAFPFSFNPMPMPFIPQIPVFQNWYEGGNVCKEEKIMNAPGMPDDIVPPEWKSDLPNFSADYSHEQETCRGSNEKYFCVKRMIGNNGEAQMKATKYECCHGFVRDSTGKPGCVESPGASQRGGGKLTSNDPAYYLYSGNSGSSSSSMSKSPSGSLDKVPIQ